MRAVEGVTTLGVTENLVSARTEVADAALTLASLSKALARAKAAGVGAGLTDRDGGPAYAEQDPLVPHAYAASDL